MASRRLRLSLVAVALLFGACRRAEVTSYRVPKEKDPELPAASGSGDATASNAPAAAGTAGAAVSNMAATPVTTASGAGLMWTAPAAWKVKPPSAMRKGSYAIGEGATTADLSITAFPGDVGGEAANVNRWRGQVSLPPLAEANLASAITRVSANGLTVSVVDFVGTGADAQRILGGMVPFEGATWFFKLMGPDALVAKEKPAFLEFLKTVRAAP